MDRSINRQIVRQIADVCISKYRNEMIDRQVNRQIFREIDREVKTCTFFTLCILCYRYIL